MRDLYSRLLLLVLATILVTGVAIGCEVKNPEDTNSTPVPDRLTPEMELRIKESVVNFYNTSGGQPAMAIHNVEIESYLGTYNGAIVVVLKESYFPDKGGIGYSISVDGIVFGFNRDMIVVWNNNCFYGWIGALEIAYDDGVLTKDDIQKIHGIYYQTRQNLQ